MAFKSKCSDWLIKEYKFRFSPKNQTVVLELFFIFKSQTSPFPSSALGFTNGFWFITISFKYWSKKKPVVSNQTGRFFLIHKSKLKWWNFPSIRSFRCGPCRLLINRSFLIDLLTYRQSYFPSQLSVSIEIQCFRLIYPFMDFLPSQSPIWFDANISDRFINWDIFPRNCQFRLKFNVSDWSTH